MTPDKIAALQGIAPIAQNLVDAEFGAGTTDVVYAFSQFAEVLDCSNSNYGDAGATCADKPGIGPSECSKNEDNGDAAADATSSQASPSPAPASAPDAPAAAAEQAAVDSPASETVAAPPSADPAPPVTDAPESQTSVESDPAAKPEQTAQPSQIAKPVATATQSTGEPPAEPCKLSDALLLRVRQRVAELAHRVATLEAGVLSAADHVDRIVNGYGAIGDLVDTQSGFRLNLTRSTPLAAAGEAGAGEGAARDDGTTSLLQMGGHPLEHTTPHLPAKPAHGAEPMSCSRRHQYMQQLNLAVKALTHQLDDASGSLTEAETAHSSAAESRGDGDFGPVGAVVDVLSGIGMNLVGYEEWQAMQDDAAKLGAE